MDANVFRLFVALAVFVGLSITVNVFCKQSLRWVWKTTFFSLVIGFLVMIVILVITIVVNLI